MYLPFDFGSPWVWGSVMSISRKLAGGEYASSNVCFLAWILAVAGWLFVLIFPDFQCNSYNALSDDVTLFAISSPISATTKKLIICRNFINSLFMKSIRENVQDQKKFKNFLSMKIIKFLVIIPVFLVLLKMSLAFTHWQNLWRFTQYTWELVR